MSSTRMKFGFNEYEPNSELNYLIKWAYILHRTANLKFRPGAVMPDE
jgi:hypothetical protein